MILYWKKSETSPSDRFFGRIRRPEHCANRGSDETSSVDTVASRSLLRRVESSVYHGVIPAEKHQLGRFFEDDEIDMIHLGWHRLVISIVIFFNEVNAFHALGGHVLK